MHTILYKERRGHSYALNQRGESGNGTPDTKL